MLRPSLLRSAVRLLAVAALLAAVPPAILHGALAAAAGTVFEATPFVLAAHLVRGTPLRLLVAAASCGCGRGLPGALSLPAAALCWLTFGPWVALARLGAALFLARRHIGGPEPSAREPLDELPAIGLGAAAASLATETLRSLGPSALPAALLPAVGLALGGLVGFALPCTTAALAVAAASRTTLPAAAFAILCTAGLVRPLAPAQASGRPRVDARFGMTLLAAACLVLAFRGGAGLVAPRLVPIVAAGTPLALLAFLRRGGGARPGSWLAPAALLAVLAAGSPPPGYVATESTLTDVFPGERITFTGIAHRSGAATIVQRFAITCCRADAAPVAIRTQTALPVPDGTWVEVCGTLVRGRSGLALAVSRSRAVPAPADPFVYR